MCVDSLARLDAAEQGGAGRIELCSRLDLGGLSPGRQLLEDALGCRRLPIHVMVRPRPGSFVCRPEEIGSMEAEIRSSRALGADGVVLGAITNDRRLDSAALERLLAAAPGMSVTFHRAFDEIADPHAALEELIALGVDRVLTGGGPRDAFEGRSRLRELVSRARGRIVVMAGGGVREHNARAILADSGVTELHGSVPFRLHGAGPI